MMFVLPLFLFTLRFGFKESQTLQSLINNTKIYQYLQYQILLI
jgi:hypothetical protein